MSSNEIIDDLLFFLIKFLYFKLSNYIYKTFFKTKMERINHFSFVYLVEFVVLFGKRVFNLIGYLL